MKVSFGKHAKTVEELVLQEPGYVDWMFRQEDPCRTMSEVRLVARRLIDIFDTKPFICPCRRWNCANQATHCFVHAPKVELIFLCDKCDNSIPVPTDPLDPNYYPAPPRCNLRTYANSIYYVERFIRPRKDNLKQIMLDMASAKGLPSTPRRRRRLRLFLRLTPCPPAKPPQTPAQPAVSLGR